eukprot:6899655-Prymnesium_polylepis.1
MKDELARTKSEAEQACKEKIAAQKASGIMYDQNALLLLENGSQKAALDATKKTLDETVKKMHAQQEQGGGKAKVVASSVGRD